MSQTVEFSSPKNPLSRGHQEGSDGSLSEDELEREREEDLKLNLSTTDGDFLIPDTKLNTTSETTLSRFPFRQPDFVVDDQSKNLDHFTMCSCW